MASLSAGLLRLKRLAAASMSSSLTGDGAVTWMYYISPARTARQAGPRTFGGAMKSTMATTSRVAAR